MSVWRSVSRILRGNIGILVVTSGIWNVASSLADPYFSLYVLALGGSYFDVGLTSALGNLFMLLPLVFAGSLADFAGRKRMVVNLGFLLAGVYVIFSQAPSWEFLLLGRVFNYLINGFRGPAFSSLLADSTQSEDRALAIALQQRIPQAMMLVSPFIGGLIIDRVGIVTAMRWFYLLTFFTCLVAQFIRRRYLKETLTSPRIDVLTGLRSTMHSLREIPSRVPRQALILIGVNAFLHLALMTSEAYYVIYATSDVIGLSATEWGLVMIVQNTVLIVCTILFSLAADRYGRLKFIVASMLLTPIATALFPLGRNFLDILALRFLFSLCTSMRAASFSALFFDYSPKAYRGRLNAFQRLASRPMVIGGSLLGGYLYQNLDKALPFYVNATVMAVTGLIALMWVKEPRERA